MTWRNLTHHLFGVRSQSPASICFLAPELLACGWLVGCKLGRHVRSSALGNQVILKHNIGSGRSDEVGWCAGLLREGGVSGSCGCRCLKKSPPIAICASRIGRLSCCVWVLWICCIHETDVIVRACNLRLCALNVGVAVVGGWGCVVRRIVGPTRCGSLRLGVVGAIGVVWCLLWCLEVSDVLESRVRSGAYLFVVVLRRGWLIGLVDWCWWMISLVPGVRRSVCHGSWPFAGVFPLERWWWTWHVEAGRILLVICVVRGRHLEREGDVLDGCDDGDVVATGNDGNVKVGKSRI